MFLRQSLADHIIPLMLEDYLLAFFLPQFLFPDLDPEGIVIPIGKGTGLIQIIDNEHPYQVLPLLCPTYYTKKGIL